MRTPLTIPAEDRELALTFGATLDPQSGQYFAPTGADLSVFQPWLPVGAQSSTSITSPQSSISLTQLVYAA